MRVDISEIEESLNKRFKKQILYRGSDPRFLIRRISTRILVLDRILGGGIAKGRTTEFFGPLSSAKSLTVLLIIAEAQSKGMQCALADTEGSFDPVFARRFGVNPKDLFMLGDMEKGEELVDAIEILIRSRKFDVIAIDSIDAMVPKAIMDKSSEDSTVGRKGQLTSSMMRKLTTVNQGHCTLILTNQVRDRIGIMFGNPEAPGGGKAIGHYASQRVEFRQGEKLAEEIDIKGKKKKVTIGHVVSVRCTKDKTGANAFRDASFKYYTREGRIDLEDQLLSLGLLDGLVEQKGNRYSFSGGPYLPERQFLNWLSKNDGLRLKLQRRVNKIVVDSNDTE